MRVVGHILALLALLNAAVPALSEQCAKPASSGSPAGVTGVINTYFPTISSVSTGATSISLGAAVGASTAVNAGDLLLVIQMQNATINSGNDSGYGNGSTTDTWANGYTALGQTGKYEFVRAANSVGVGGGTLNLVGATGGGLINNYVNAAATTTAGASRFQVVRVPQYSSLTLTGTITAAPWNGTSGGVAVMDVADRLTFAGGSINATGAGFRGGAGRQLGGGAGGEGDYRSVSTLDTNGSKGEGIAGTPRYVFSAGAVLDTGVEGYPSGSYGRGAPGNAGGGGTDGNPAANDQNTGGGGGGNYGAGGKGGNAWCPEGPETCDQYGGHPGGAVPDAVDRLVMGGGGGAGTTNNGTGTPGAGLASSGAAGGGIVIVRAGEIAGAGTIFANGADGNQTIGNDAGGGAGAGGSVMISSLRTVAGGSISVQAEGGRGGSNDGGGAAHGPGGGGGGGYVASNSVVAVSASTSAGSNGTTVNGGSWGSSYGAKAASTGTAATISGASVPGVSSGGECTPTVAKAFSLSPILAGMPTVLSVTVTNNNPDLALTSLAFTDTYPAGLANTATPGAAKSCTTAATLAAAANGGSLAVSAATIAAGGSCSYTVNTTATSAGDKINTIAAGGVTGAYGTIAVASLEPASAIVQVAPPLTVIKSSSAYMDGVNGFTNPKLIPGAIVAYTITVTNTGTYTVGSDSLVVIDAAPANLQLYVADANGAGSGPVLFTNGTPSSGLTYTYSSLASTTDGVDFYSAANGWSYTPVPDANGVDTKVTQIRIRPKGAMAPGSSFSLRFGYRIN